MTDKHFDKFHRMQKIIIALISLGIVINLLRIFSFLK
jgi:hypothetical protein